VTAVACAGDGRLASGSEDGTVRIWDLGSNQETKVHRAPGSVQWLAFNPSGPELASMRRDGSVQLWDVERGQLPRDFTGPKARVLAIAYSSSGGRLATAHAEGTVKIWDVKTGMELLTMPSFHEAASCLAFSADGTQVLAGAGSRILIADAAPLTPERRDQREARSVVRFLFGKDLARPEVLQRIRSDPLLTDAVRARALDLAEHYPEPGANRSTPASLPAR
jgi:hypothetical protein